MPSVKIYNDEDNRTYTVSFDLKKNILIDGDGTDDIYLVASTTIRKPDGSSFGSTILRSLYDVPPGSVTVPADDFTDLCNQWVIYYQTAASFTESSSSSSSSVAYSSSSSSSELYSTSSSSSSELYSTSSSSSLTDGI